MIVSPHYGIISRGSEISVDEGRWEIVNAAYSQLQDAAMDGMISSLANRYSTGLVEERPWGTWQVLDTGPGFTVKRIVVLPGQKLSLQKHMHRAEHWVVVSGTALATCDTETHLLDEQRSIYLPLGSVHRLENPGRIPLVLIEVQVGSYLDEKDIMRFEDSYGRS